MCKPASMIITRGHKVHWSENSDSHYEIREELDIREKDARGNINIVLVEIYPENNDYTIPLPKWKFSIDFAGYSRELPEWFDSKKAEKATRAALKYWAKQKLIKGKRKELNSGQYYLCGKAEVQVVNGTSKLVMRDLSTVQEMWDSSTVIEVKGSCTVIAYNTIDPNCLKSTNAVLVDRSSPKVIIRQGKANEEKKDTNKKVKEIKRK